MQSIEEKKEAVIESLSAISDKDERFSYLIDLGRKNAEFPEEFKQEKYRIQGCLSQLWLYPELREGRVFFQVDSDAAIPKGIATVLIQVYSNSTPEEILNMPADFLRTVGIEDHLSMNRKNGLANIVRQIKLYATAFKAMANLQS